MAAATTPRAELGHGKADSQRCDKKIEPAPQLTGDQMMRKEQETESAKDDTEERVAKSGEPRIGGLPKGFGHGMQTKPDERFADDLNEELQKDLEEKFHQGSLVVLMPNARGKRRRKERSEWRVPTKPVKMAKPWALLASA